MACVHLARCTLEEHGTDAEHSEVLPFKAEPFKAEQHRAYQQRVLEALGVAGDALASAYPMLERIAEALDADETLKAHTVDPPPATSPASRARRAS